jgi:hypothetical protein
MPTQSYFTPFYLQSHLIANLYFWALLIFYDGTAFRTVCLKAIFSLGDYHLLDCSIGPSEARLALLNCDSSLALLLKA